MPWRTGFLYLCSSILGIALPLCARDRQEQPWKYKLEIFGDVAHGRFYNGDHLRGKGLDYGGGVGIRPFQGKLSGLGFEARIARLSGHRSTESISSRVDSRLIAVSALYHFRSGTTVQPFVSAGIAKIKEKDTYHCTACVFDRDPVTGAYISIPQDFQSSGSKNGLILGAGIKLAIHRYISLRPEFLVADTTPGTGPNWSWCRFQIGMGLHF